MDLYEKIITALKEEYEKGATYQEMAEKYGLSYSYLRELLLGIKPVGRMSLDFFFKLFPHATVAIHDSIVAPVINNGTNSGVINAGRIESDAIDKILSADELTAEEKVKVIKVLKK